MPRRLTTAERYAQQRLVLEMVEQLRGLVSGSLTRSAVASWATGVLEATPRGRRAFEEHGVASSVYECLHSAEDCALIRDSDLRAYLRWLTEGEAFKADDQPIAVLRGSVADYALVPWREPPVRFWVDGLGFYSAIRQDLG